jgi:hypothetical protein
VALVRELMTATRVESLVTGAGAILLRIESPKDLPPVRGVTVLVVDWGDREPDWGAALARWRDGAEDGRRPRIVLFGPHTDLAAHAAAREAGLGPMRARSAIYAALPDLFTAKEG